jgi:cathepsin O
VITKVRNQKTCGACWAFSTAETVEAMYAIKTGTLYKLSVQEVSVCSGASIDQWCCHLFFHNKSKLKF